MTENLDLEVSSKKKKRKQTDNNNETNAMNTKDGNKKTNEKDSDQQTNANNGANEVKQKNKEENKPDTFPNMVIMEPISKADCVLVTKDHNYAFKVHSVILEATSPVFRDLDFSEPIVLDVTKTVLGAFLENLYHQKSNEELSLTEWLDVGRLCYRYEIHTTGLFKIIDFYTSSNILTELVEVATFAKECNDSPLYAKCIPRIAPLICSDTNLNNFNVHLKADLFLYYFKNNKIKFV